jgi:multidrug resistance efflux pump
MRRIRLDRTKKLAESGVIAQQQLDAQQAQYDGAEAALRSSRETVRNIRASIAARRAALALAQKKLADAKITRATGWIYQRSSGCRRSISQSK